MIKQINTSTIGRQSTTNQNLLLNGTDIQNLPQSIKIIIASQVSKILKLHKSTMLQFEPNILVNEYMNTGNSVIMLDSENSQLVGFAKNYRWSGKSNQGKAVYEFGSWFINPHYSGNNYGSNLAQLASSTIRLKGSNAQLVSVCADINPKPINILKKIGSFEIPKPSTLECLLGEGQTKVTILDMTDIY